MRIESDHLRGMTRHTAVGKGREGRGNATTMRAEGPNTRAQSLRVCDLRTHVGNNRIPRRNSCLAERTSLRPIVNIGLTG